MSTCGFAQPGVPVLPTMAIIGRSGHARQRAGESRRAVTPGRKRKEMVESRSSSVESRILLTQPISAGRISQLMEIRDDMPCNCVNTPPKSRLAV